MAFAQVLCVAGSPMTGLTAVEHGAEHESCPVRLLLGKDLRAQTEDLLGAGQPEVIDARMHATLAV